MVAIVIIAGRTMIARAIWIRVPWRRIPIAAILLVTWLLAKVVPRRNLNWWVF
jgi:hypothetical protein